MSDSTPSLRDQLLDTIFSGKLSPGDRLVERDLAAQLGVSRIPIREALMQLASQGVVVSDGKARSLRLPRYTRREILELFQFREMIEAGAIRQAALHATARDLDRLQRLCDRQQREIGKPRFAPRWADLEVDFHMAVATAGGHERFIHSLQLLLKQWHYVFYRLRWQTLQDMPDDTCQAIKEKSVEDHREIIAALGSGEPDTAEAVMRRHISDSYTLDPWPDLIEFCPSPALEPPSRTPRA